MSKPREKREAVRLRRAGLSLGVISERLHVSKSSVFAWVRGVRVPASQKARWKTNGLKAAAEAIAALSAQKRDAAVDASKTLWAIHKSDPFFTLGIGLYWGEGNKTGDCALTNADPGVITVWLAWLKRYAPAVDIRVTVTAHSKEALDTSISYWRGVVGDVSFCGVISAPISSKGKRPSNRLPYGTARVFVRKGSAQWLLQMAELIRLAGGVAV
jgi:hypothetical protein